MFTTLWWAISAIIMFVITLVIAAALAIPKRTKGKGTPVDNNEKTEHSNDQK